MQRNLFVCTVACFFLSIIAPRSCFAMYDIKSSDPYQFYNAMWGKSDAPKQSATQHHVREKDPKCRDVPSPEIEQQARRASDKKS